MPFNLIESVRGALPASAVQRAGSMFGLDANTTQNAVSGIVPTLIGGIARAGSTDAGAEKLHSALTGPDFDERSTSRLSQAFASGDPTEMRAISDKGQGLLGSLFGDKIASGLGDGVARASGIGGPAAKGLMGLVMPLIAGLLGRHVREQRLDARGLKHVLDDQERYAHDALPSGFSGIAKAAGLGGLGAAVGAKLHGREREREYRREHEVVGRPTGPTEKRRSVLGIAVPLAILAFVAIFGIRYVKHRRGAEEPTANLQMSERYQRAMSRPEDLRTGELPRPAAPAPSERQALAPGQQPVEGQRQQAAAPQQQQQQQRGLPAGSPAEQMATSLASGDAAGKTFTFQSFKFRTGEASLDAEGKQAADEVAEVLDEYPNARIKVVGHTDATGDREMNEKLAEDRAKSVGNAIVGEGIEQNRIETEGVADERPVATDRTTSGRALNRRTDVVIVSQ